ncbi:hypothetical protein MJO29_003096 [Puccinia striiformis f. sp. tritici]|nr:hypothetical protein MJO29_003096 [Puccinia striiformis f. sp. tritici]
MDGARNKILISYALDPQNESDRMHQLQLQFKKSSDVVVLKELIKPIFVEVSKIRARLERKRSNSPMGCITPSKEVSDMGLSLQIYEPHSPCYILTDLFTHGYIQNMKSLHLKFFPSSMRIVLMLGVALAAKYHSIPVPFCQQSSTCGLMETKAQRSAQSPLGYGLSVINTSSLGLINLKALP